MMTKHLFGKNKKVIVTHSSAKFPPQVLRTHVHIGWRRVKNIVVTKASSYAPRIVSKQFSPWQSTPGNNTAGSNWVKSYNFYLELINGSSLFRILKKTTFLFFVRELHPAVSFNLVTHVRCQTGR